MKSLDTFGKATKKYNYEDHLEKTIVEVLIPKLKKKGLNLEFLSRRKIGENQLSRAILDIKSSYRNVIKELYPGKPWKEDKALFIKHKLRGTTPIYDTLNTDLVVILDFDVQSKTSGAMTRDVTLAVLSEILIGVRSNIEPAEIFTMRIAIVHAPTGRVLWAHNIY
ncbi:MAG: hypothetical protein HRU35_01255 [Rickettsiaceae bacterium]|nr:hypothetical protein [Rickettsiaceae bacterium]